MSGVRTTRLRRTLSRRSLSALPASTATRPTIVAIMIRPSERDGMARDMPLICPSGKAKYFLFWGLTRFLQIRSDLPVGSNCRACSLRILIASQATQSMAPREERMDCFASLAMTADCANRAAPRADRLGFQPSYVLVFAALCAYTALEWFETANMRCPTIQPNSGIY